MGKGRDKGTSLGKEDFLLWRAFTRDIDPFVVPDWEHPAADMQALPPQTKTDTRVTQSQTKPRREKPANPEPEAQPPQLDARTEARLRRGQMPVEGRLDLHGCTQDEAHKRLNEFVVNAQARGKRCVLVITGKGLSRSSGDERTIGVLRQKLPLWLSIPPLRGLVLKYYPAVQRDGGTGAWYLYLKRSRDC